MQVKDQTVIRRNKYSVLVNIVKAIVTAICIYFLWAQFQNQDVDFTKFELSQSIAWVLVAVFILMLLNWFLEALRWKVSVASFEKISIKEALGAILGGLALNWVLPFTAGDFAARLIERKDKYQATSAIILNRGIMLALTVTFGLFSLNYLDQSFLSDSYFQLIVVLLILALLFFFRKRLDRFLVYFNDSESKVVLIITISIVRYLVFTFQFCWLLYAFNTEIDLIFILTGVGWIFFVRSIVPHLLGGIGLRETASIVFFTPYVLEIQTIVFPVFLIWIINTTIPSIVGLLFIWKTGKNGFI